MQQHFIDVLNHKAIVCLTVVEWLPQTYVINQLHDPLTQDEIMVANKTGKPP